MANSYTVHVVPEQTTEGESCYLAYHPELEGCMSHGTTIIEALQGLDEARQLYLKTLLELGEPIPAPAEDTASVIWQNFAPISVLPESSIPTPILPRAELQPTGEC
ncbi:MAG: type II toxin-antitoxin system HicB family antitoxin [Nitrospira sp.]|nr:MAG: type II toxin-antitoxin system HicB family antitoxin [Nitrospira sp.]